MSDSSHKSSDSSHKISDSSHKQNYIIGRGLHNEIGVGVVLSGRGEGGAAGKGKEVGIAFRPWRSKSEAERRDSEKPEIHKTRFANPEFANHKAAIPNFDDLFQVVE